MSLSPSRPCPTEEKTIFECYQDKVIDRPEFEVAGVLKELRAQHPGKQWETGRRQPATGYGFSTQGNNGRQGEDSQLQALASEDSREMQL